MTKRRWREGVGLTALNAFFIALCFLTLIPILYALSVSFNGSNSLLSSDSVSYTHLTLPTTSRV